MDGNRISAKTFRKMHSPEPTGIAFLPAPYRIDEKWKNSIQKILELISM
jgi:hypothetical protein